MTDERGIRVTADVRSRVVGKAKENLAAKRADLPAEFMDDLSQLLGGATAPKADAFLELFEKQVGGEA
ncbi:MAG: hypothetical protein ACF8NJ_05955 [Phycisphaerales bacterium JB038]